MTLLTAACFFLGTVMAVVQVTVQSAAGRKALGTAAGSVQFSRTVGAAFGTALLGSILFATLAFVDPDAPAMFGKLVDMGVAAMGALPPARQSVMSEAIAFAGHFGLDNLVLIYDSNDVTLDAMAEVTQSYDACKRFEAFGWDAVQVDGHDLDALHVAITAAKTNRNGKPKLIEAKTIIGKGIPQVAGTAAGHGEGGAKFSDDARKGLGLPEEHFYVSEGTRAYFADHGAKLAATHATWEKTFSAWQSANPELAKQLDDAVAARTPENLLDLIPEFAADYKGATRASGGDVIQAVAKAVPSLITALGESLTYRSRMTAQAAAAE
jgi:transketolase